MSRKQLADIGSHITYLVELDPPFRKRISEIFEHSIDDEAWRYLDEIVQVYAADLSRERLATTLTKQEAVVSQMLRLADTLIEKVLLADRDSYGRIVSREIDDWGKALANAQLRRQNRELIQAELVAFVESRDRLSPDKSRASPAELVKDLINSWQDRELLPSEMTSLEKFIPRLQDFRTRLSAYQAKLLTSDYEEAGGAWLNLVDGLTGWARHFGLINNRGIAAGASKGATPGRFTRMMMELLGQMPEPLTRPIVDDATLADTIIEARRTIASLRKAEKRLRGDTPKTRP